MEAVNAPLGRAHPRSRGENIQTCVQVAADLGSSPLTRGKRYEAFLDGGFKGLIPAHAGKTSSSANALSLSRAHPRSRGENLLADPSLIIGAGSSPLTRGKRS